MKPQIGIVAERALAQHCPELLKGSVSQPDRKQAIAEWLSELSAAFGEELRSLLIGPRPVVAAEHMGAQTAASLEQSLKDGHIHYLVSGGGAPSRVVAAFDIKTALALTDRLFGGSGTVPEQMPERLPQSASFAVERVVRALVRSVDALAPDTLSDATIQSHQSLARLEAFPRGDYCCNVTVTIEQDGFEAVTMSLLILEAELHALVDGKPAAGKREASAAHVERVRQAPFNSIPLEFRAALAELQLPLEQIAGLKPGQMIPLALRRDVPLLMDDRCFANGTVGTIDDQVALRLTQIS